MEDFDAIEMQYHHRHVEIRLGNYCNFDCSFCSHDFKGGTHRPLSLDSYKKMVDNLTESTPDQILFTLQGGEPTLWPHLQELLAYIKTKNAFIQMFSNGSRTFRWWEEFLSSCSLDRLIISHHAEQNADPLHTEKVMKFAAGKVLDRYINVTTMSDPALFEKTVSHGRYLQDSLPGVVVNMSPIMIKNTDSIELYTTDQLDTIKEINSKNVYNNFSKLLFGINTVYGGERTPASSQKIMFNNKNKFNKWDCDAGTYRLVVETDEAYTGICRVSGVIGKVSDGNVNWLTAPIKCNLDYCNCGSDIIIPKRKSC